MLVENSTVEIDKKTLESLVRNYVAQKTCKKIESVSFKQKTVTSGFGMNERDEVVFGGCVIKFAPYEI